MIGTEYPALDINYTLHDLASASNLALVKQDDSQVLAGGKRIVVIGTKQAPTEVWECRSGSPSY
jgi:hypothetical protein